MFKALFGVKTAIVGMILLALLLLLPQFLPRFYVYLIALIFAIALLATSLNMVLGYGGMYQFHHAVFYGVGAYAFALFAVKSGLPLWIGYLIAPFCSAALGLVMGLITVRLNQLYFGMLQISLGSLVWAITYRWYSFTGGDDGIHGIPLPDLVGSSTGAYYFNLIVVVTCFVLMYMIVNSPFGRIFQGIRDNPERCRAVGVNVQKQQLAGQTIAAFFAGVAGTLFVTVEGSVFPDLMFWTLSLEILIMCLLGGWFIFLGPALGAAIIISLRTFVGIYTEYWTLILGIVLMLLIFFLPEGVLSLFLKKADPSGKREG
ncbi:branched-chain amino acid ABC transporter permease [Desulfosarcina sp.]|uniref:branched-chain amino acid ABC transporter permease n=1 Tax=Desulfosarcina sp. TaxID=2027861 RepID=UPI0029A4D8CD|nr:branched-chain amino acid ABC transporter permease [Desulfosarcina sp.]MDX2453481.1 branched-chain amino acid ABC transporter permease [Desulfosarcina sp.]MDX2491195.1 branched-chain amino acid ABC transporter permease [Desulfosarcina sp.]